MSETVRPVPSGFHTVTPYLIVDDAARAIAFYREAFGADELQRTPCPHSGRVLNAKLAIGDSIVMLSDAFPEMGCVGPSAEHPSSVTIHLYVDDVDRVFDRAVDAGAAVTMPLGDTFWGDRYGCLRDPFGHAWSIASRIEALSTEEVQARARHAFAP